MNADNGHYVTLSETGLEPQRRERDDPAGDVAPGDLLREVVRDVKAGSLCREHLQRDVAERVDPQRNAEGNRKGTPVHPRSRVPQREEDEQHEADRGRHEARGGQVQRVNTVSLISERV
jgi:hypothetical protein